jgi:uncharacterized protein YndB with AHSA1/START domain
MSAREQSAPGPASGAQVIRKEGDTWTLVLTRVLRHPPEKVWEALTDPAHLHEWAPYDASGSLATTGAKVKLTTVGAPQLHVTDTTVTRAEKPRLLEYNWGDWEMRWELEPSEAGTRITLWTGIDRRYIAMGAAGWHVRFETLDHLLSGTPTGRLAGPEAMKDPAFQQLHMEYAKQFKIDMPKW